MFLESLWAKTDLPISVTALTPRVADKLNIRSDGSNSFSTIRFAIPHLCYYAGWAIWLDGADMLMRADIGELLNQCSGPEAVKVVKHDYHTKHQRKYIGTTLETGNPDYERKNWSSVILWNCGHWAHFRNRDKLLSGDGKYLHRFSWLADEEIGELPKEWNWLVGEYDYNAKAKIAHYTLGLPGFEQYRRADYAQEWTEKLKDAARGLQYLGK